MSCSFRQNVIVSHSCSGEVVFAPGPVKRKLESLMIRSSLFAAASALALTACQPAADSSDETLVAETPPVAEAGVEAVAADASEVAETVEVTAADAEDEAHDHAEDHGDDNHDEEAHDHDDDQDGHDHAGGEAHVHGLSDLAISLDGDNVSISVEGALANFDLDESLRTLGDAAPYTDGVVDLIGGDCARDQADASIRPIGDHGNLMIDLVYTCAAIDAVEAVSVTGFESFSGFEEVNAVVLTDAGQTAATLTKAETRLDLK